MAPYQSTYTAEMPKGQVGRRVNAEEWNTVTRTATADLLGFGQPVNAVPAIVDGVALMSEGTLSAVATAQAGNTGDAAMPTVTVAAGTKQGRWRLVIETEASNAGTFDVVDPDGILVGNGTVAVAFAEGGLSFTLADGANDWDINDTVFIDVSTTSGRFEGITEADPGTGHTGAAADTFSQYDNVPVMKSGVIWVLAGGSITRGQGAYWDSATKKYVADTTKTRIPNAHFDSAASLNEVVALRLGLVP